MSVLGKRLGRLEEETRARFLANRAWPECWAHVQLADGGILAEPGLRVRLLAGGDDTLLLNVPDDMQPTVQEQDMFVLGYLLQYAGLAWFLFGLPGGEEQLTAVVRDLTGCRTLQAAYDQAVAVGRRYGLVEDTA